MLINVRTLAQLQALATLITAGDEIIAYCLEKAMQLYDKSLQPLVAIHKLSSEKYIITGELIPLVISFMLMLSLSRML